MFITLSFSLNKPNNVLGPKTLDDFYYRKGRRDTDQAPSVKLCARRLVVSPHVPQASLCQEAGLVPLGRAHTEPSLRLLLSNTQGSWVCISNSLSPEP